MSPLLVLVLVLALMAACSDPDPFAEVRALQADGRHRDAARRLGELIDESPREPAFHFEYAKALLAIGERTRAIWPLRTAAESEALAIEAGALLAQVYLETGNAPDAVVAASAVLARDEVHRVALFTRSRAYAAAKRPEDALSDAEAYLDLAPDDLNARLHRVSLLLVLENVDEAERAIARLANGIDEGALDADAESRLCVVDAVFTWEKGEQETTGAKLAGCLERFPDRVIAVGQAVAVFDQMGETERANQTLRRAIEAAPGNLAFRNALAGRMRASGEHAEAEQLLREAIPLLPGSAVWLLLHDHFVAVEDYASARHAIEEALEREPEPGASLRLAYADDLILVGDLEAAEQVARELAPPSSHLAMGRILLQRGEPAAALGEFEEGLKLWPDNPTARWLAGQAAERVGDFPTAIAHYRESVRSDAARSRAAKDLAEIYALMGVGQNAVEFAGRYLEANPHDPQAAIALLELSRRFGIHRRVAPAASVLAAMPEQADRLLAERALDLAARGAQQAAIELLDSRALGLEQIESLKVRTRLDLQRGDLVSADERVARLLETAPDSVELRLLAEEIQVAAGVAAAERRATLTPAMAKRSSDRRVQLRLAQIDAELGAWKRAVALLDEVPPDEPAASEARFRAIEILAAAQPDAPDLEARLEALLDAEPRHAKAALALAEQLLERDPTSERARARARALARRALLLGEGAAAAEVLERVQIGRGASADVPEGEDI